MKDVNRMYYQRVRSFNDLFIDIKLPIYKSRTRRVVQISIESGFEINQYVLNLREMVFNYF